MKWIAQLAALTLVTAAGTWWGAWWMVPLIAAVFGAWGAKQRTVVFTATLAGALAWGALLAYDASLGPVGRLTRVFGAMFRMSGGTLIVLTIAYAALLAAAAAVLARGVRRLMTPA
jgi:hypothetical protein